MPPSVITIGGFDGVHAGHQALIARARDIAATRHAQVVAFVLDPSPATILHPATAPQILTTFGHREELLRAAGVDEVRRVPVSPDLLKLAALDFLDQFIAPCSPVGVVEGPDFRFGHDRRGTIETIRSHFALRPQDAATIPPLNSTLCDHSIVPARSTMARWLISHGRVRDAAALLSRPYEVRGVVIPGERRGRSIGYPTVNIDTPQLLPGDGVYAAIAHLPDARAFPAATSIGDKPTFNGQGRTLEAFLLNPAQHTRVWAPIPGLNEYHWPIRLQFITRIRDQVRFAGLAPLLEQIARDCHAVDDIVRRFHHSSSLASPPSLESCV